MRYLFLCLFASFSFYVNAAEPEPIQQIQTQSYEDSDEIYWNTPPYLSKLEQTAAKVQYVYHRRANNFFGDWIIPLNVMPYMDGYKEIYEFAISKYNGREWLLSQVIPTLGCLWNDVVFLSPLHPHKHYEEYMKIGFAPKTVKFFKIPVEVLKDKRVTVWKWLSYKKYPSKDPIHESLYSYCELDFALFQEMDDLPEDTKEFYRANFDHEHPDVYPRFNWYRIPHILCEDPIDTLDPRITVIDWKDPIED